MSLGNQEAPRSILASGTFFSEDLVMKIFLRLLIQEEYLSVNGEMICVKYWKVSKVSKYTLYNEGDPIGGTNLPWGPLKQINKPFINNNKQNL